MKRSLAEKLCCPIDKNELDLHIFHIDEEADEILEALFTCPTCRRYFPVIYGIPVMTPDEFRENALEAPLLEKWGIALDQQEPTRLAIDRKRS